MPRGKVLKTIRAREIVYGKHKSKLTVRSDELREEPRVRTYKRRGHFEEVVFRLRQLRPKALPPPPRSSLNITNLLVLSVPVQVNTLRTSGFQHSETGTRTFSL